MSTHAETTSKKNQEHQDKESQSPVLHKVIRERRNQEIDRARKTAADDSQTFNVLCKEYERCLGEYHSAAASSVIPALALAEVVWSASQVNHTVNLRLFRSKYRLQSDATFSQFKTIGENAERLRRYKDHLPHAWTSLYTLARVGDPILDKIVAAKALTPMTTRHQLAVALKQNGFSMTPTSKPRPRVLYEFVTSGDGPDWVKWEDVEAMRKELAALLKKYGFRNATLRRETKLKGQSEKFWALKTEATEQTDKIARDVEAELAAMFFETDEEREKARTVSRSKAGAQYADRKAEMLKEHRDMLKAA